MPEGDTIMRARNRVAGALLGQQVSVTAPNPRGRAAGVERLDGKVLDRVDTHGKNLLLYFGDVVLHSHLGMNGSWQVYPRGARWRRSRNAAWAVFSGERAEVVQFGGSTMRLLRVGQIGIDPQLAHLGPDILSPSFDVKAVVAEFRKVDQTRTVGETLLDQRVVAGIGNIFKNESCFAARVNPWHPLTELSDQTLEAILTAAHEQMLSAVTSGRHPFAVYRRRGPCVRCSGRVMSHGQGDANRTTWWCEKCQQ